MRNSSNVDVAVAQSVDEPALECRYCGCTQRDPCWLNRDYGLARRQGTSGQGAHVRFCGWHRVVELLNDDSSHQGYFAVCTNAECVRAYLADRSAP